MKGDAIVAGVCAGSYAATGAWALFGGDIAPPYDLVVGVKDAMIAGLCLAVLGLCFKITAVPMHFYAPDVYEGAAVHVSAFLAFVPKVAGFVALTVLLGTAGWTGHALIAADKRFDVSAFFDYFIKERQNAAEVALRAQKFYEDKQHDQTELDNLRSVLLINLAGCASSVAPAQQCPVPTPLPEELKQPMPPIEDNLNKIILVS